MHKEEVLCGETKRQLHERFGEHPRSIQNHHQLIKLTPVSTRFDQQLNRPSSFNSLGTQHSQQA